MSEKPLALIAAPDEVDGLLAGLDGHGIVPLSIDRMALCEGIGTGSLAAAVISDAIIGRDEWQQIADAVACQPAWSDFPIVLIADGGALDGNQAVIDRLGNVSLVERPADPAILANAVRTAFRARDRQRQTQRLLVEREAHEAQLESEVEARTADLKAANVKLRATIAERKKVEAKLRDSEELHRFTVELSGQFAWTAEPDGRVVSATARFLDMTGLPLHTDPHEAWTQVVHPDDIQDVMKRWEQTRAERRVGRSEFRVRQADGSYRMFRARAMPRFDAQGDLIRWYGVAEDIQEEKEADAARRAAEERYHLAVMASNDAIWNYDVVSRQVHWADSAGEALGFTEELGSTSVQWWEDRVHPEDRDQATLGLREAIRTGAERWTSTYRFRTGTGEYRAYFDRGFLIRDEAGDVVEVVGAMADITERQRAEEELRRMQAELIHVSRLSAMGTMASTLAHELNQPLTAVTSYLRGARHLLGTGEDVRGRISQAVELAESGALRAGQIVRRLRDLVAKGTAAMRPEDLPKLIEDAAAIAFIDADFHEVTRRFDLDPEARWVEVDRIQIQQVLINLVRNAIQAMQDMACREIVIRTKRLAPTQVEVSVVDTGTGIRPEVRQALFSPFQGTKAEGLGIGLSISRTIVEAHGGKIWAEDRPEGGAIFCFTIPASEKREAAASRS